MTMQHNKKWVRGLAAGAAGLMLASTAQAQITLAENEDGWKVMMMGLVSVWSGIEDFDEASGRPAEQTTRVITGFNPSKLEFLAFAPEYNGISVSAYFQLATSINGAKTRRTGEQIEVRAADISVAGSFGTFSLGRSFAIHDSLAIVNDTGSMRGVGYICTGPDGAGPNCGHIGTGYTWTDWTSGIRYATPRVSGLQLRIGAFDPIEAAFGEPAGFTPVINDSTFSLQNFSAFGAAIDTSTPLIEADVTYSYGWDSGTLLAWASGMYQDVETNEGPGSTSLEAFSLGGRLTYKSDAGVFGLTGNWTDTQGIAEGFMGFGVRCNATACDAVEGNQWYANADFTFGGKTTIGVSYGEGSEEANAVIGNGAVDRELLMAYIQHNITPNLNLNIELQSFERKSDGFAAGLFLPNEEYDAILVGAEFRF